MFGDVYCSGTVYQSSDKNLKKNIREFKDAISIINRLKPQNYEFKNDAKYASLNLPSGSHYGLIAQDVEEILPNLVKESTNELKAVEPIAAIKPKADGKPAPIVSEQKQTKETIKIKAVDYIELIPILVKGMQEQQVQIQDIKSKNDEKDKTITKLQDQVNEQEEQIKELKSLVQPITKQSENTRQISSAFTKQNAPQPLKTIGHS